MEINVVDTFKAPRGKEVIIRLSCYKHGDTWSSKLTLSSLREMDEILRNDFAIECQVPSSTRCGLYDETTKSKWNNALQLYFDSLFMENNLSDNETIAQFLQNGQIGSPMDLHLPLNVIADGANRAPTPRYRHGSIKIGGDDEQENITLNKLDVVRSDVTTPTSPTSPLERSSPLALLSPYGLDVQKFEKFLDNPPSPRALFDDELPIAHDEQNERASLLMEIYDSELKYVEFTTLLWNMYVMPLTGDTDAYKRNKDDVCPLSTRTSNKLFPPNLEKIIDLHLAISTKLCHRYHPYINDSNELNAEVNNILVGDVFLYACEMLDVYVPFLQKYDKCTRTIRKWRSREPLFDKWLNSRKKMQQSKGLDLGSLLIMPVQRIPRYLLLLKSLLKLTPEGHPDKLNIESSITQITNCATRHNELIRSNYKVVRTIQLSKKLQVHDLHRNGRRVVCESNVVVNKISYLAVLLSDLLILENQSRSTKERPAFSMYAMYPARFARNNAKSIVIWVVQERVCLEFDSVETADDWMDQLTNISGELTQHEHWERYLPSVMFKRVPLNQTCWDIIVGSVRNLTRAMSIDQSHVK
ncbi:RacGEF [Acrasis kona]|uniref:RacGEF n=1 Tax=Acrasis kona TaxID=1008807 RepID=A0AAW2YKW0_9EUKA